MDPRPGSADHPGPGLSESGLLFADTHFCYGSRNFLVSDVAGRLGGDRPQSFWPQLISEPRVAADLLKNSSMGAVNGNRKYNPAQPWRIEDSLDLYHVNVWGFCFFLFFVVGFVVVCLVLLGFFVFVLFVVV